jgi:hypothetical protein
MIALNIYRTKRQDFRNASARRPQDAQEQPVALAGYRIDNRFDVVWGEPFRRLPVFLSGSNRTRLLARI